MKERDKGIQVGDRFGQLKVIQDLGTGNKKHSYLCECSCGSRLVVRQGRLLQGTATRCKVCAHTKDRVGNIYRNYKVIRQEESKNGVTYWECECQICHAHRIINAGNLTNERIPMCGCEKRKLFFEKKGLEDDYAKQVF